MGLHQVTRIGFCLMLAGGVNSCGRAKGDRVDEIVAAQLKNQHIPGVAVVVIKDGKIVKSAGYGVADVDIKTAVTPETLFQIQSMTKQFTAAGILMLVEEGKIGLDDPIGKYLDGSPAIWEKITIRHLLSQTSGLKDFINEPVLNLKIEYTDDELLKSAAARPLNFQPGDVWAYSNTNYQLLAMIIRKVTGQWYGDFLAQRIFNPLNMTRTSAIRAGQPVSNAASGYAFENGKLLPASVISTSFLSNGGSGIRTTILDMAKWDAALYEEKLLTPASLAQLWTPVRLNNGSTHDYGFGWEIGQIAGHRMITHGGNFVGFSAHIARFVDDHLTVVVLTNLFGAPTLKMARSIAAEYIPALAPPVYTPITDTEPQTTARLLDLLGRSTEGGLRAEEFSPEMWVALAPRLDQMRKDFTSMGGIEKLTLVECKDEPPNRSYRYLAQFKRTRFILQFLLTKDGKIARMMPEEVNQ